MLIYDDLDPQNLINPEDILKPFPELVEKAEILQKKGAPKMLVGAMLSLALEIEINRRRALAVMNPLNPESLELVIPAFSPYQFNQRSKIIKALKKAGWTVKSGELPASALLTAKKLEKLSDGGHNKRRRAAI